MCYLLDWVISIAVIALIVLITCILIVAVLIFFNDLKRTRLNEITDIHIRDGVNYTNEEAIPDLKKEIKDIKNALSNLKTKIVEQVVEQVLQALDQRSKTD